MMSTPSSWKFAGTWMITAVVLAAFGLLTTACQSSDSVRKGGEGEYCNGPDDDCRDGLVCEDFVCTFPGGDNGEPAPPGHCDVICERLDDCDASLESCVGKCQNTTEEWGEDAVLSFRSCFTDTMSCEELQESDDPPQDCYDQIPLDEERESVCEHYVQSALDCAAGQEELDSLDRTCRAAARTQGDDDWAEVEECSEFDDTDCDGLLGCLNDALDVEFEETD